MVVLLTKAGVNKLDNTIIIVIPVPLEWLQG